MSRRVSGIAGDGCATRITVKSEGVLMSLKVMKFALLFAAMVAGLAEAQSSAKPAQTGKTSVIENVPAVKTVTAIEIVPAVEIVPIDKEPSHHLVFENEYVRVFSVEVAPHSETKFHQHDRDYVFVTLGDSDVESVRVGGASVHLQPKDGDAQFTKGGFAHKAVNKSDRPFRNVTVELKKGTGELDKASSLAILAGPRMTSGRPNRTSIAVETSIVDSERVHCSRLSPMGSAGGDGFEFDSGKYLVIAVAPTNVNRTKHDQGWRLGAIDMKDGDVRWIENVKVKFSMTGSGPAGMTYCKFEGSDDTSRQKKSGPNDKGEGVAGK
jgi:beta-alanine degradation protein BauB